MSAHPSHVSRLASPRALRVVSRLTSPRLLASLLFLIVLAPRLPGLNLFLTTDEPTLIFSAGSDVISALLRGDLRGTYWHFYPGITMSWLDAIGMVGKYLWAALSDTSLPPFTEFIYNDILSLLVAVRLPYVILTAVAVPAVYLLARKLLPERIALLGVLFLAFDPFFLAHSRVVHGDAPVTVFMALSALTFLIYTARVYENYRRKDFHASRWWSAIARDGSYLYASAVLGGLAALTKGPGQFMVLFVVGMAVIYAGLEVYRSEPETRTPPLILRLIMPWVAIIIMWGLISLAVFVLLWPAMWIDPIGTLQRMLLETFKKVDAGHLVYFWGQPSLDPGPWFYPYVIPFRLTPVTFIGIFLSLLALVLSFINVSKNFRRDGESRSGGLKIEEKSLILLWLFVASLLLFGNLSPKKQDRYLLALFPFLNLLAAAGWMGLFNYLFSVLKQKAQISKPGQVDTSSPALPRLQGIILVVLLLFHLYPVFTYYPYYLAYFNPLMGGPTRASQTTLMGWGEGMEQVAAYLNTKPNAAQLYVASTPSQTFLPYFVGTGENFYTNDIAFRADYVVLYLAQMQRLAPSPEIVHYFEAQEPEKVITIQSVTYAKIYPGPKLILTGIPAEAIPVNIGLGDIIRLAGYKIPDPQSFTSNLQSSTPNLQLTLYWHALAPLPANYTISVRARAADGQLLAQQDAWPVDGLLPTSQWRQGDYVTDTHTLDIPTANRAPLDHFEVVVYNADTGETLGPPIILPLANQQ